MHALAPVSESAQMNEGVRVCSIQRFLPPFPSGFALPNSKTYFLKTLLARLETFESYFECFKQQ